MLRKRALSARACPPFFCSFFHDSTVEMAEEFITSHAELMFSLNGDRILSDRRLFRGRGRDETQKRGINLKFFN
jgi:hypothetical protein